MEDIITIAAFDHRDAATVLAERLQSAGYAAEVYDESNEQKWKLFNIHPRAHFHVRVHSTDERNVLNQLEEWIGDPVVSQAIRCPDCGSFRVEYPQFSRRTLLGALPAAAAAAGIIEKNFFCESCHFTWPAEIAAAGPELDILNWPVRT